MRRIYRMFWVIVGLCFVFFTQWTPTLAKENEVDIALGLNDKILPFSGVIIQSVAYAPLFLLTKEYNAKATYEASNHTYILSKNNNKILINTVRKEATYNGKVKPIHLIEKGKITFIPVRWIAEQWGYKVDYLSNYKTVRVYNEIPHLSHVAFLNKNKKEIQKWVYPRTKQTPPKSIPRKVVYLTFDDGPSRYSMSILHTLLTYNAKATFFYIEPNIRAFPSAAKKALVQGNYLGLHSVTHSKYKTYSSPKSFLTEMKQTQVTLKKVTGFNSSLVRAPYGSKPYLTQPFRDLLAINHYRLWDWTIDTEDWKYGPRNPQRILENIILQLKNVIRSKNKPIIILMHEQKATSEKLPKIIQYLKAQGYEFRVYNVQNPIQLNFWNDKRL
jgi:peptidoglycan/xylan/chitin deacetylase (PgdA/CDA1 family)